MPTTDTSPDPLTPGAPLWAWAFEAITQRVHIMLEHAHGVRAGEDIEAVHDMRVASRRLVAAMRVFRVCYPKREFERLLKEARQVTRALGEVRDLDVLIDHYQKLSDGLSEDALLAAGYLIAVLRRRRKKAHAPAVKALERLEKSHFPKRVERYVEEQTEAYVRRQQQESSVDGSDDGHSGGVRPESPFRAVAVPLLVERYHELYSFEPYVAQPEAAEQLHEMRIAAKWLRYTMELFAPAYADELKDSTSVVKRFQELLGDLHDSDVRLELLAETVSEPLEVRGLEALRQLNPTPVSHGLEELHARETQERTRCYTAFSREWDKQERKGFRHRCLAHIQGTGPLSGS